MASKVALAVDRNQRWAGAQVQGRKLLFLTELSGIEKGNREDHIVFLPCITILISFSPDNDNATTAEVRLSRARREKKPKQNPQSLQKTHQSFQGWLCSPGRRCSSHQYQPSWAAFWAQEQTRFQYHGGQGWDAPGLSRNGLSPCRVRCEAYQSCYPNNLSWQGQWTAWQGWLPHGWLLPPLWSTSLPDPRAHCSHQWQQRPVNGATAPVRLHVLMSRNTAERITAYNVPWTWCADQPWSVSGQAWSWAPHLLDQIPRRSQWSQTPAQIRCYWWRH